MACSENLNARLDGVIYRFYWCESYFKPPLEMKMTFNKNKDYTRTDIQKILGGELQSYLPQKKSGNTRCMPINQK